MRDNAVIHMNYKTNPWRLEYHNGTLVSGRPHHSVLDSNSPPSDVYSQQYESQFFSSVLIYYKWLYYH